MTLALFGGVALAIAGCRPAFAFQASRADFQTPTCTLVAGGLDWLLATAVIGNVVLLLSMQCLSLLGAISFASAAVVAGLSLLLGVTLWWRRQGPRLARQSPAEPEPLPCRLCAVAALMLATWMTLYYLVRGLVLPVEPVSDAPIYHLPFAIQWWKAGRLIPMATPFGELAATYFPANGSVWLLWLVLCAGSETAAKVGQGPFLLLCASVIYGLGRLSSAGRSAAVFPAVLWCCLPTVAYSIGLANVDLLFAAWYLIALYFLCRFADAIRAGEPGNGVLVLSALSAGLALGTKSVGLVFVPLLVLPAVVLIFRRHAPATVPDGETVDNCGSADSGSEKAIVDRHRAWQLLLLVAGLLLPSGYWYARNFWLTGNPLYPLHLEVFGHAVFAGWYDRAVMDLSGYHVPTTEFGELVDRMTVVFDLRLAWLWPLALLTGCASLLTSRRGNRGGFLPGWLSLLSIVHLMLFWWVVPYNTQERFLLAAFGCGLVPLARLVDRRLWLQVPLVLLLGWHLLTPSWLTQIGRPGPMYGGILLPVPIHAPSLGPILLALVLPASVLMATLVLLWRPRRGWVLAGLLLALGSYGSSLPARAVLASEPLARFYPFSKFGSKMFPTWQALDFASGESGTRVAYAGTNLPYYLFGQGLRNQVFYINVAGQPGWLAHDFHLARLRAGHRDLATTPWPPWYRQPASFSTWLANLRAADIRLLFIARENLHGRAELVTGLPPFPIEMQWACEHPEYFEPIGPQLLPGDPLPWAWLYRVNLNSPAVQQAK